MTFAITWYGVFILLATADGVSAAVNIYRDRYDRATFNFSRMAVLLLVAFEVAP